MYNIKNVLYSLGLINYNQLELIAGLTIFWQKDESKYMDVH